MTMPQPSPLRRRVAEHAKRFPEFDPPSVRLVLAVRELAETVTARMNERLQEGGLSFAAVKLLSLLESPEPAERTQSELGVELGVTRANVSGLMEVLERKGLVERVERPGDRRVRLARLTPAGREALAQALGRVYGEMRVMLGRFAPEHLEDLAAALEQVRDAITPG